MPRLQASASAQGRESAGDGERAGESSRSAALREARVDRRRLDRQLERALGGAAAPRPSASRGAAAALRGAAARGDVAAVAAYLAAGVEPSAMAGEVSPLRAALAADHAPVVALLLDHGARFGRGPDEPLGALGWAVAHQASASLSVLLDRRGGRRRRAFERVLSTAADPALLTVLDTASGTLPHGAERMVWDAARVGDADAVGLFLRAGVGAGRRHRSVWPQAPLPQARAPGPRRPRLEGSAVHVAALGGHAQVIHLLRALDPSFAVEAPAYYLEGGCPPPLLVSPLGLAVSGGHGAAACALVEAGAAGHQALHDGAGWTTAEDLAVSCSQLHLRPLLSRVERLRLARQPPPPARRRCCGLVAPRRPSREAEIDRLGREVEMLAIGHRADAGPARAPGAGGPRVTAVDRRPEVERRVVTSP